MKPPPIVLSGAQMKQGVEACFRNAEGLRTNARRMLEDGEGGLALAFAAIRIEELGKVKLLRDRSTASETDADSWKILLEAIQKARTEVAGLVRAELRLSGHDLSRGQGTDR